jgi:mRNA-degrading endonuclease YafQ of YafQ-DinJ toxin-antitoxin module
LRSPIIGGQFRRDVKLAEKRGKTWQGYLVRTGTHSDLF